jgi:hypothetical protein
MLLLAQANYHDYAALNARQAAHTAAQRRPLLPRLWQFFGKKGGDERQVVNPTSWTRCWASRGRAHLKLSDIKNI